MTTPLPWRAPRSTNPTRIVHLSPRQADVLTGIALGLSNQDIADRLHLGLETVRTHIKTLFAELWADNRTDAVRLVYTGEVEVVVKPTTAYTEAMRRHPAGRRLTEEAL